MTGLPGRRAGRREQAIRWAGIACSTLYAFFIVWLYAQQPQTVAEVTGGLTSAVGVYQIDAVSFEEALAFFRADRFAESRAAFQRADPASRDPRTQFYVAYSYYRQGWGRTRHDDELYTRGLEVLKRAVSLAPQGRILVDDPDLGMHSADELRAEFERGLEVTAADFNPLRVFEKRK